MNSLRTKFEESHKLLLRTINTNSNDGKYLKAIVNKNA
jgi:hypothetical protein